MAPNKSKYPVVIVTDHVTEGEEAPPKLRLESHDFVRVVWNRRESIDITATPRGLEIRGLYAPLQIHPRATNSVEVTSKPDGDS